jgi:cobalt-zinc-cadmium efflux system outer membrane protein
MNRLKGMLARTRWQFHGQVVFGRIVARSLACAAALASRSALAGDTNAAANAAGPTAFLTTPSTLGLGEAQRIAFENNWDLLAAKANVDLATAQKIIAHEFPNPTLSLSTTKISTDGQPNSTPLGNSFIHRSYDSFIAFNQLYEIGGKRGARRASAQAGYEGAVASMRDARRTLDLGISQAFIGSLLAETNVGILRQSAASTRKEAVIAETRLKAGDISATDMSQIVITADQFELQASTAAAASASARVAVEQLMGITHPRGVWTSTQTLSELSDLKLDVDSPPAGPERPDLAAAKASIRKADADLRLQKALRIPDPTWLVQYERNPPSSLDTIGVGVAFPLPLWNRNRGAIEAAKSTRDQAKIQADKIQGQISADILDAQVAYREAAQRLQTQLTSIQPRSAEVVKNISFAYQKGGASLLDLLSAERNDNTVRVATAQAAADTATAAAALRAALNLLRY